MEKKYEFNPMNSIDRKFIKDADEFKYSLLGVIDIVKSNILNNQFEGIILGEDLDDTLSKYGRLNMVNWYVYDNKTYIVLDYFFQEMDESIRNGFDKYNLINFDYLKDELENIGVNIDRSKKYNLKNYDINSKLLVGFTDKLVLTMPAIRKGAPRLADRPTRYTRKLLREYNVINDKIFIL